jgi:hypothetical protein
MNAEVVFPMTFYPGTPDAAIATVVQLDGGQQLELEPMTLPPPRRPYRLAGMVVFEDGSPASGASISLQDGTAPPRQVALGMTTEIDGTFAFVVHEGLSVCTNHVERRNRKARREEYPGFLSVFCELCVKTSHFSASLGAYACSRLRNHFG